MVLLGSVASSDGVLEVDFVTHVAIGEHVSDIGRCGVTEGGVVTGGGNRATSTSEVTLETVHGEAKLVTVGVDGVFCWGGEIFGGVQSEGSGKNVVKWCSVSIILEGNDERVLLDDVGDDTAEGRGIGVSADGGSSSPNGQIDGGVTGHPGLWVGVGDEVPVP